MHLVAELRSKYFASGTVNPFASANMQVYTAPTNWKVLDGLVVCKAVGPYRTFLVILTGHIFTFLKPIVYAIRGFFTIGKFKILCNYLRKYCL